MENSEGIKVAIRVRPLNERELKDGQEKAFRAQISNNSIAQLRDNQVLEGQVYYYDKIFDDQANTSNIYDYVAKDIVQGVIGGINGCIFAYGQTSSGEFSLK